MNNVPESVLHEALDFMEHGESIEQILSRFPHQAVGLRPFLETAAQLVTIAPQPSLAAKQKSQKAFLAHAESLKVAPARPSSWYRLRQILLPLASLALVVILFGATAVSVSGSAIPGDALYSVKRMVETVRLNRADGAEAAVALMEGYQDERIREVQTLLRTGRTAEVTFEGEVEAIQTEEWTVATVEIVLTSETIIDGKPQLEELARVTGKTQNGFFIASRIEMLTGTATTPIPEVTIEPTTEPSIEPTATGTLEPTVEPTEDPTSEPTAVVTVTSTKTPMPTATLTPTLLPTATATPTAVPTLPPDNDNGDDGDDNNNDNDGDTNDNSGDNDNDSNDNDSNDNSGDNDNDANDNDNDNDGNDNDNDNDSNDNDDDDDD